MSMVLISEHVLACVVELAASSADSGKYFSEFLEASRLSKAPIFAQPGAVIDGVPVQLLQDLVKLDHGCNMNGVTLYEEATDQALALIARSYGAQAA